MPPGDANAMRRASPGGMAFSGYLKPVILAFSDKVYVAPHLGQVIVYESGVRTKPQSSHKLRTPGIGTSAPQALHFPVVSVEWKEFRSPDFYEIKRLLKNPIIFDGRNQYDTKRVKEYGISYYQIGVRGEEE